MNEQIDILVNKIYDYAKFGSGEKKLVDYVDEIHELVKSERAKAVREFTEKLMNDTETNMKFSPTVMSTVRMGYRKAVEEFLAKDKPEEGK